MAKQRTNTIFLCNECGAESAKWLGKCPSCGAWNSLSEYTPPSVSTKSKVSAEPQKAVKLSEIDTSPVERIDTGITEFNRVLGGGGKRNDRAYRRRPRHRQVNASYAGGFRVDKASQGAVCNGRGVRFAIKAEGVAAWRIVRAFNICRNEFRNHISTGARYSTRLLNHRLHSNHIE